MADKKVKCLDCNTEFEISKKKCPQCGLNMHAIMERDRHERALSKLRKQRETPETEEDEDEDPLESPLF